MRRRIIIFFGMICLFCGLSAQEQEYLRIKNSDVYYTGESFADKKTNLDDFQLRQTALSRLILQIQSTVSVKISDSQTEQDGKAYNEMRQQVAMSSTVKLRNVRYVSYTKKKRQYMLAYLNKAEYRNWLSEESQRLVALMKEAEEREAYVGFEALIPDYLNLYAQSLLVPQAISWYSDMTEKDVPDMTRMLYNRLQNYLKEIQVKSTVQKANPQVPDLFPVQFELTNHGSPVNHLKLLFDNPDNAYKPVVDGKAELYCDGYTSGNKIKKAMTLGYLINMPQIPPDIQALLFENPVNYSFYHELDFSQLVRVGFTTAQTDATVRLVPVIENISVNQIEWQFGDGTISNELRPVHEYGKNGEYEIRMIINQKFSKSQKVKVNLPYLKKKEEKSISEISQGKASDILLSFTQANDAVKWLIKAKADSKLIFGKKESFQKTEQCYIIVFHPDSKEIIAVISPETEGRQDLKTQQSIEHLDEFIKNKGSIWVQFIN